VSEDERPKVTITLEVGDLRSLFMAGNHSAGGAISDINPLALALDIIEHAAMELMTLHLAIQGDVDNAFEDHLASHAWRVSRQIEAGGELVGALRAAIQAKPEAAS
jgi:hypothetical protein